MCMSTTRLTMETVHLRSVFVFNYSVNQSQELLTLINMKKTMIMKSVIMVSMLMGHIMMSLD